MSHTIVLLADGKRCADTTDRSMGLLYLAVLYLTLCDVLVAFFFSSGVLSRGTCSSYAADAMCHCPIGEKKEKEKKMLLAPPTVLSCEPPADMPNPLISSRCDASLSPLRKKEGAFLPVAVLPRADRPAGIYTQARSVRAPVFSRFSLFWPIIFDEVCFSSQLVT